MDTNVLGIIIALLSLVLGGIIYLLLLKIFNGISKNIETIEDKRENFDVVTKELLKSDFEKREDTFANDFTVFEAKIIREIYEIKDIKKKLALKEALSLLKKQDVKWYEKYFSSIEPTDEMIDRVYQTNVNQSSEKYTEFIEIIKNS